MQQIPSLPAKGKPGEVVTLPTGEKILVGIDGEYFPYSETPFTYMPDLEDDEGGENKDGTIRLQRGAAIKVQLTGFKAAAVKAARHWWHGGLSLVCPATTSAELLSPVDRNRECPLCGVLDSTIEWFLPVVPHSARRKGGDWKSERRQLRILRFKGRMLKRLLEEHDGGADLSRQLVIIGRKDDEWGTYFVEISQETAPELKKELAPPPLVPLRVEGHEQLVKFAETVKAADGIKPSPGRVAKWQAIFPYDPLVALWWGRKKPVRSGYLEVENVRRWMADPNYLRRMDEGLGIALLLIDGRAVIDLDRDADVDEFERRNPWSKDGMSNKGGRGRKYFVKIKGDYPQRVIHAYLGKEHVGEFRGAETAILDNLHPSGKLYEFENEGRIPEIAYSDIVWPEGWVLESPKSRDFEKSFSESVEGGLLDLSLLKNVHPHPTKAGALEAQCPACAEAGTDKSGNHLILFDEGEGRFGCAIDQSSEHYSRIFALAKNPRLEEKRRRQTPNELLGEAFADLVEKYGEPFSWTMQTREWTDKDGQEKTAAIWTPTGVNQRFFASFLLREANNEDPAVFDRDQQRWVRYNRERGFYGSVEPEELHERLDELFLFIARECDHFLVNTEPLKFAFRTTRSLTPIVSKACGLCAVDSDFWRWPPNKLPVLNGVLDTHRRTLAAFSPDFHSRGAVSVKFRKGARSPKWTEFLKRALPDDDIDLLQRFFGLVLLGRNVAQKLVILVGTPQSGKGVIVRVLCGLVGTENVASLRTEQLEGRFEMGRLRHKLLIYGADVPQDFLNNKGASRLKGITGGDPESPEYKNSNATPAAEAIYGSVLVTCNSRLRLRLESDKEAWRRRIVLIPFTGESVSEDDQRPDLDRELLAEEGDGILNWALEGLAKLEADGRKLRLSAEQQKVRDALLEESESYTAFARECVIQETGEELSAEDAYAEYVSFCHSRGWTPLTQRVFGGGFQNHWGQISVFFN